VALEESLPPLELDTRWCFRSVFLTSTFKIKFLKMRAECRRDAYNRDRSRLEIDPGRRVGASIETNTPPL